MKSKQETLAVLRDEFNRWQEALLAPGRYAWLGGHPLYLVLAGSQEHHAEHRTELLTRPQL
jgi:hypothetical protein